MRKTAFLALLMVLAGPSAAAPTGESVAEEVEVKEAGPPPVHQGTPEAEGASETAETPPLSPEKASGEDEGPILNLSEEMKKVLGPWAVVEVLGVAVWQFLAAFVFILLGLVLKKVSDFVMERKMIPLLKRSPWNFDHMLAEAAAKPLGWLFVLGGLAGAVGVMRLPVDPNIRGMVYGIVKVLLAGELLWFLFRIVDVAVQYLAHVAKRTDSKLDDQLVPLLRKALKVTIGVFCGVWVIQMLGYSVSSLIAGLGIGGLAVALALQDTLSNFFGSIFIFLDQPFAVGDLVKMGEIEGTVERIGFRSTRVRAFDATLISIPNKHVADSQVDNWTKRPKRRVLQTVGVTYETTAEEMEAAVADIRALLEADEDVDQEYMVVRFADFGDSSLNVLVLYFTKSTDYAVHMEVRERMNLQIMRALRARGLSIAFPTRTVYFEGDIARAAAGRQTGPGA